MGDMGLNWYPDAEGQLRESSPCFLKLNVIRSIVWTVNVIQYKSELRLCLEITYRRERIVSTST